MRTARRREIRVASRFLHGLKAGVSTGLLDEATAVWTDYQWGSVDNGCPIDPERYRSPDRAQRGHYVMVVKGNHPTLATKIQSVFDCPALYQAEFCEAVACNKGHGRIEERRLRCTYDLPRLFTGFAGVRQVFCLERAVTHCESGKVNQEIVYGMTSLPRLLADANVLLSLIRGHWTIESGAVCA
jgi:hypothetical protein